MSPSKFEHLPNEILISIFEFFDGFHLVSAFGDLNYRLTSLINNIHLHFNLTYCRQVDFDYLFDHIFPSSTNVHSLILSNYNTLGPIEMFIARFSNLIPHNLLRCLKLMEISLEALNVFFRTVLPNLTDLVSLTITTSMMRCLGQFPIEIVHSQLSLLRHVSLSVNNNSYQLPYAHLSGSLILYQLEPSLSTVTHLSLQNFTYDIIGLPELFEKLCKVEYLQITLDIDDEIACWDPSILDSSSLRNGGQNLRSLVIQIEFGLRFSEIASLLNHFPKLQNLSLATCDFTWDMEFYNGQKWEQLIQTSLPCLISFRLYLISKERHPQPSVNHILDGFRSPFWLNKKWYVVGDKFLNGSIQLYTVPCPKNSVISLNIISSAWDTTLPFFTPSTFDSVTRLKINATEMESNPMPLPYFNNVESIDILSLPTENYRLSQHINLLQLKSVTDRRGAKPIDIAEYGSVMPYQFDI